MTESTNRVYEYHVVIRDIIDGDTVDVDIDLGFNAWIRDERIRLSGVDCPETRTSDKVHELFGEMAKAFTADKLQVGERYIMRSRSFNARGDMYGRVLADFIICESDQDYLLTDLLLRDSHAIIYEDRTKAEKYEAHKANFRLWLPKLDTDTKALVETYLEN